MIHRIVTGCTIDNRANILIELCFSKRGVPPLLYDSNATERELPALAFSSQQR